MRKRSLLLSLAAILWIAGPAAYAAWPPLYDGELTEVAMRTRAVPLDSTDQARAHVGHLVYMGGIELKAGDHRFGGLSDMLWEPECGRLLAISDTGLWIILEPFEDNGRLVGIGRAYMAPILDSDGKAPARKRDGDAEGLMRQPDGTLHVWFEQDHRAQRYAGVSACRPETLATVADAEVLRLAEMADWPANGGAEAVLARGDHFIVLSEAQPVEKGRDSLIVTHPDGEGEPKVGRFVYMHPDDHSPTALAERNPREPDSPLLVLHRHFSLLRGVSAILGEARIDGTAAQVEPRILARLSAPLVRDNMEAIAVRTEGDRRFVYLASDDNFNPMQKTLLLKFELLVEPVAGER